MPLGRLFVYSAHDLIAQKFPGREQIVRLGNLGKRVIQLGITISDGACDTLAVQQAVVGKRVPVASSHRTEGPGIMRMQ